MPSQTLQVTMDPTSLNTALADFLSTDKATRDSSVKTFTTQHHHNTIPFLAQKVGDQTLDVDERKLCAVLLRLVLRRNSSSIDFQDEVVKNLRLFLLETLQLTGRKNITKLISPIVDVISIICEQYQNNSCWPELELWYDSLVPVVGNNVPEEGLQLVLYQVTEALCCVDSMKEIMVKNQKTVLHIKRGFELGCSSSNTETTSKVREGALKACKELVTAGVKLLDGREFDLVISHFSSDIINLLTKGCVNSAEMQIIVDLTDACPKFWSKQSEAFLNVMGSMAVNNSLNTEIRALAIRALSTLITRAPKWSNKNNFVVARLSQILFTLASESERACSDKEYVTFTDPYSSLDFLQPDSEESEMIWKRATHALEEIIFCHKLTGILQIMHPLCYETLKKTTSELTVSSTPLRNESLQVLWSHTYASINVFSAIIKNFHTDLTKELVNEYVNMLLVLALKHPNLRVRQVSLICIDEMTMFMPFDIYKPHIPSVLVTYLETFANDDSLGCRYVSVEGITSVLRKISELDSSQESEDDNENEGTSKDKNPCSEFPLIQQHVVPILQVCIIPSIKTVEDKALQAFGLNAANALALCCGTTFTPYYTDFIGVVKQILHSIKEESLLPGSGNRNEVAEAAIKLTGALTSAVESGIFLHDFEWFLIFVSDVIRNNMISQTCSNDETQADHSLSVAILDSLNKVVSSTGKQFQPYLDAVFSIMDLVVKSTKDAIRWDASAPLQDASLAVVHSQEKGLEKFTFQDKFGNEKELTVNPKIIEMLRICYTLVCQLTRLFPRECGEKACPMFLPTFIKQIKEEGFKLSSGVFECTSALFSCLPYANSPETFRQYLAEIIEALLPLLQSACATRELLKPVGRDVLACLREVLEALGGPLPAVDPTNLASLDLQNYSYVGQVGVVWLEEAHRHSLIENLFNIMGQLLLAAMNEAELIQSENAAGKQDDGDGDREDEWEYDDDPCDMFDDDDEEEVDSPGLIYDGIMQCTTQLLRIYKEEAALLFKDYLAGNFLKLLEKTNATPLADSLARVAALCALAETVDCTGDKQVIELYSQVLLSAGVVSCVYENPNTSNQGNNSSGADEDDNDVMLLQASSYAIGIAVKSNPQFTVQHSRFILPALEKILNHPRSHSPGRRLAADCAVNALFKIHEAYRPIPEAVAANPQLCSVEFVSELIKNWFPLKSDRDEQHSAHSRLLQHVSQNSYLGAHLMANYRMVLADIFRQIKLDRFSLPVQYWGLLEKVLSCFRE